MVIDWLCTGSSWHGSPPPPPEQKERKAMMIQWLKI